MLKYDIINTKAFSLLSITIEKDNVMFAIGHAFFSPSNEDLLIRFKLIGFDQSWDEFDIISSQLITMEQLKCLLYNLVKGE